MYEAVAVLRIFIFNYSFDPSDLHIRSNTDSRSSSPVVKNSPSRMATHTSDNGSSYSSSSSTTAAANRMFQQLTAAVNQVRTDTDTVVVIPPEGMVACEGGSSRVCIFVCVYTL